MSKETVVSGIQNVYNAGVGITNATSTAMKDLGEKIDLNTGETKTVEDTLNEKLLAFKEALYELGSETFNYETLYEEYLLRERRDEKALKSALKEKVVEVINEKL